MPTDTSSINDILMFHYVIEKTSLNLKNQLRLLFVIL